jgi:hypothetical protein
MLAAALSAQQALHPSSETGTWDLAVWAGHAAGREDGRSFGRAEITMAGVRVGRVLVGPFGGGWIRGSLEYGFDIIPLFVASRPEVVWGGGFDPIVLKWNFATRGRLQPFLEAAGGGVFTTSDIPPGDTSTFNFVGKIGGGVHIFTANRQAVSVSLRYWHLSNANLGDTNPAFNGVQIVIGYHWFR